MLLVAFIALILLNALADGQGSQRCQDRIEWCGMFQAKGWCMARDQDIIKFMAAECGMTCHFCGEMKEMRDENGDVYLMGQGELTGRKYARFVAGVKKVRRPNE